MSVLRAGQGEYVDQVDDTTLIRGAIDGMLAALDPHSLLCRGARLRPAEDHDRRQLRRPRPHRHDGGRRGQGDRPDRGHAGLTAPGSRPATTSPISTASCSTAARSTRRSRRCAASPAPPIKLTIVRPGRDKPFDVTITRGGIELRPVKWEVKDGVGIININTFAGNTADADQAALMAIDKATGGHAARLYRRPALQSRRAARPGGRRQRRLPRARRDRLRSAAATRTTSSAITPGPATWPTACRSIVLVDAGTASAVGDRRRRAPGPSPRDRHGRAQLRQGLGPDRRPDSARQHRAAPDHRALLHAVGPLGSGGRDRPRHQRAAAHRRRLQGPRRACARPTFAATCSTRPRSRTSCSRTTTRPIRASPLTAARAREEGHQGLPARLCAEDAEAAGAPPAIAVGARRRSRAERNG